MKKYVLNSPVANVLDVEIFKRNYDSATESRGVLVNSTHLVISDWSSRTDIDVNNSKAKYSSITYKGNRQAHILPESTASNTVITSDGLVGVVYSVGGSNYISVIDLYDKGNFDYDEITPGANDYEALQSYVLGDNPEHKRVFIYNRGEDEEEYLSVNNTLVYQKAGNSYFLSQMDYTLITDIYGHYIVKTDYEEEENWENDYSTVTEFQFFKKQFFVVSGPSDLKLYIDDSEVSPYVEGTNIYYFSDLNIYNDSGTDNRFLRFKLKSATSDHGTVIVY
jgi:hypothetical protein